MSSGHIDSIFLLCHVFMEAQPFPVIFYVRPGQLCKVSSSTKQHLYSYFSIQIYLDEVYKKVIIPYVANVCNLINLS